MEFSQALNNLKTRGMAKGARHSSKGSCLLGCFEEDGAMFFESFAEFTSENELHILACKIRSKYPDRDSKDYRDAYTIADFNNHHLTTQAEAEALLQECVDDNS
jgi:hypothetical protein